MSLASLILGICLIGISLPFFYFNYKNVLTTFNLIINGFKVKGSVVSTRVSEEGIGKGRISLTQFFTYQFTYLGKTYGREARTGVIDGFFKSFAKETELYFDPKNTETVL